MELDIHIDAHSLSIPIQKPFALDIEATVAAIEDFFASKGIHLVHLDMRGLLPRMVKGIAGCEAGCPSNAKELVSRGFKNFNLAYVEGGILTAKASIEDGKAVVLKMFPDF